MKNNKLRQVIFKFNNGNGALLCSNCFTIIKTYKDFNDDEKLVFENNIKLKPRYCENCKK